MYAAPGELQRSEWLVGFCAEAVADVRYPLKEAVNT